MDDLDISQDAGLEIFTELNVPDITSSDPEERRLARRIRIQKRVGALQRQQLLSKEFAIEEKQPEKPTILQNQLDRSSDILKQLFLECEEQVTNIRVANDAREVDRREEEGVGREMVFQHLEEDVRLATQMFEEISSKWENVMRYNDPLNIHEEIRSQKEKCDELIKQKDDVIAMLRNEVKMAEAKFFRDQKLQNEDISTLAKRVEKQVTMMRNAHRIELQAIEDVMIQERANMMENNDKRWLELYKKREEQELAISENKFSQKTEFEEVVTKVRITHYERIREVKIRLERDCEVLQQEFEYIKATALANREKMDYNYQILKKREDENIIIKSNQKRRLNKLRDVINSLRSKINLYKTNTENEITKLYNEVLALHKCIASVKNKSANLSKTNEQRYMQVWDLNRRIASKILCKLITIDKLLHEQQLGLKWEQPPDKLIKRDKLPSYIEAVNLLDTLKEKSPTKIEPLVRQSSEIDLTELYKKLLVNVLEKISERSSFLIEYKLRKILEPLNKDEGDLIKVDNVFSGLGITSSAHINLMLKFFMPYVRCTICTTQKTGVNVSVTSSTMDNDTLMSGESESSFISEDNPLMAVRESDNVLDEIIGGIVEPARMTEEKPDVIQKEGECLGPQIQDTDKSEKMVTQIINYDPKAPAKPSKLCVNHPLAIDASSVLKAVREFVASTFCTGDEEKTNIFNIEQKTLTISRLLSQDDVRAYWNRYRLVLDDKKIALWDSLWYGLKKYHAILEDRCKLNESLICLRRQNMELKHLLSRYKSEAESKPPCAQQRDTPVKKLPKVSECRKRKEEID